MITTADVVEFLREVHGAPPFPWQLQLAEAALAGDWPTVVDAPTGLGKTWSIDIAVLAMANAGLRGERDVFRRVLFVVDRRTVVDEAWEHSLELADKLRDPEPGSVSARVAEGLLALVGGTSRAPLTVTRMRGGVTWDSRWADRPDQPMVILSTIDQVGSRLLFRGYGVSNSMRPIHAALVGCHSMLILDEAHLATSFAAVLEEIGQLQATDLELPSPRVMSLSATPGSDASGPDREAVTLPFDVEAHLANEESRRRLTSEKRLCVMTSSPARRAAAMVAAVRDIQAGEGKRILVVCNTIVGARHVHTELANASIESGLLIGRSRPIDREVVTADWLASLGKETDRDADPVVLVATQTVEVGVNLDVDWLVTEECALNALIQRLGRVNRFGRRIGSAIVVATGKDDPVYGEAAPATTRQLGAWGAPEIRSTKGRLSERASWLDVSPLSMRRVTHTLDAVETGRLNRSENAAPMLDRQLFDGWAQTSPVPAVDVPIGPYLHGLGVAESTVTVAWRSDLPSRSERQQLLVLPVVAAESIELPLSTVRRWLCRDESGSLSDLDGIDDRDDGGNSRRVARATPRLGIEWVDASRLRPGDTLVFSVKDGGIDRWGWAPDSTAEAFDVADLAERRGRYFLRTSDATLRPLLQGVQPPHGYSESEEQAWLRIVTARSTLTDAAELGTAAERRAALTSFAKAVVDVAGDNHHPGLAPLFRTITKAEFDGRVLIIPSVAGRSGTELDTSAVSDEVERSTAMIGKRVALHDHGRAVAARARFFAEGLGLPPVLVAAVELAARWHDLGKLDPRFQAMLWGGVRAHSRMPLLAKSGIPPRSPAGRYAQHQSGYPTGMRHEALSAALAEERLRRAPSTKEGEFNRELVVHLIASHHGRARPLQRTVDDLRPRSVAWSEDGCEVVVTTEIAEDLDRIEAFDRLNSRYGPWGLALLESIVRLADMSCSSEGC